MTDPNDARFSSEILSLTTANPGWQVRIQHLVRDPETKRTEVEEEYERPVVAWAIVNRTYADGQTRNEAEPIFTDVGSLINATEYRRLHSDLDPEPGQPTTRINIRIEPPIDEAAQKR